MSDNTAIEWTDATVNFWWGCTKVGPGCDGCYAETWARRTGHDVWGVGVPRRKIRGARALILRLQNADSWFYADHDRSRRVFIQSMSDLFDVEVPLEWFAEAWELIELCDDLDLQIVTKRLTVIEKRLAAIGVTAWPKHAGLIISVVNQEEADRDVPRLIELKRKLGIPWIGLSMEPLLGPVVLADAWLRELNWVIVGGESGSKARPMHPDWASSLRDQCAGAGIPFLFKQWGEWVPSGEESVDVGSLSHEELRWRECEQRWSGLMADAEVSLPDTMNRVGKKAAGRLLDGVQHDGYPA